MNYTLIAHEADYSYVSRCGDFTSNPGNFKVLCSSDLLEFGEMWAKTLHEQTWDDVIILVNGKRDDQWSFDETEAFYDAEREMYDVSARLRNEAKIAEAAQKEREAAEEAAKKIRLAEIQREADMAKLEELKAKLGVK